MAKMCFAVLLLFFSASVWGYLESEEEEHGIYIGKSRYSQFQEHKYPSDYYFSSEVLNSWRPPVYQSGQHPYQYPGGNSGRKLPKPKFPYIS